MPNVVQFNHDDEVTILVADDSYDILLPVQAWLEDGGFRVLTATNGQEAIEALQQNKIHLAILDFDMPVMNGGEVARWIREDKYDCAIMMITGAEKKPEVMDAIVSLHADDIDDQFVKKPINKGGILGCVAETLKKYKLRKERDRRLDVLFRDAITRRLARLAQMLEEIESRR